MTSVSRYISSASCYHPRYQIRSLMYIRGLIPWNFAELAEAVPIETNPLYGQEENRTLIVTLKLEHRVKQLAFSLPVE